MKTLRELYRVDNKYWMTGDTDILPKRMMIAMEIDERFYSEINGIARMVTQRHMPVRVMADVLSILGYDIVDTENDGIEEGEK